MASGRRAAIRHCVTRAGKGSSRSSWPPSCGQMGWLMEGTSNLTRAEPASPGKLLITGVVRRVLINDISPALFAFWTSVLRHTDDLCRQIRDVPLSVEEWDRQKEIFRNPKNVSTIDLGLSFFYLNRTNRSGILNGGVIGGRKQEGGWRMDARFQPRESHSPDHEDRRMRRAH